MEKVPTINMFTQRQLKKSNSLSRINNDSNIYRPSSTLQQQVNSKTRQEDYYGQAMKLLNADSKITSQLRNIQIKHDEDSWKKSNLKKMARHKPFQSQLKISSNVQNIPHIITSPSPQMHAITSQGPQIHFNNSPPNMMRTNQTYKPNPTFIPNNTFYAGQPVQVQQVPFHIIPQNHQMQQNNVRIIQQIPMNPQQFPCPPHPQIQRRNSAQNLHFGNYSYADKTMSQCNIAPICNNQQDKPTQSDKKEYTFRNKKEADSPVKTYNPFLFDATYLLEIKESESRLPDITALISHKQYSEELDRKQELLQQLYEIREQNVVQSKQFLHQLDCLINQFQSKQTESKPMQESVMRNSRRSLFSKLQ